MALRAADYIPALTHGVKIDGDSIETQGLDSSVMASNAIVSDAIAASAVTNAKITDDTIRPEKLSERADITYRSSASIDLSTSSTVKLTTQSIDSSHGGDRLVITDMASIVDTKIISSTASPVITIQDGSGNSLSLTDTFSNGDSTNNYRIATRSDNGAGNALNLNANSLQAKVTTVANGGSASGAVTVIVNGYLF